MSNPTQVPSLSRLIAIKDAADAVRDMDTNIVSKHEAVAIILALLTTDKKKPDE